MKFFKKKIVNLPRVKKFMEKYADKEVLTHSHPLAQYGNVLYCAANSPYFSHKSLFRPFALQIELINVCNNDCIFCPPSTRTPHVMDLQSIELLLEQYAQIGGGDIGITPIKGEVFLDKEFKSKLVLIENSPFVDNIYLTTNAAALNRWTDDDLREIFSKVTCICVSLYGFDSEEHTAITKKNDYNEVMAGIKRLLSIDKNKVIIMPRQLIHRTTEYINEWVLQTASQCNIGPCDIKIIDGLLSYANYGFFDTTVPLPSDATWAQLPITKGNCAIPLLAPSILTNGDVSLCSCRDISTEIPLGNIHQTSLKDILESEEYLKFWDWDRYGIPDCCKDCSFYFSLYKMPTDLEIIKNAYAYFNGIGQ